MKTSLPIKFVEEPFLQEQVDKYAEFYNGEKAIAENNAKKLENEAKERLGQLIDKIPEVESELRGKIQNVIDNELRTGEGLGETLAQLLQPLDPISIGDRLRECDRGLLKTWLELAKLKWYERCQNEGTGGSLTALRAAYKGALGGLLAAKHNDAFRKALPTASCWVSTAMSSMSIPMERELFDLVMIDEASQCTITNILPFLYRARRVVVIGDRSQLPPIPDISESQEEELAQRHDLSDFEAQRFAHYGYNSWSVYSAGEAALPGGAPAVLMLLDHFRCQPSIVSFSNRYIYRKALNLRKYPSNQPLPCAPGVNVVDVPRGQAERGDRGKSWINVLEARAVTEQVRLLFNSLPENNLNNISIGVITAFRGQKEKLQAMLRDEINQYNLAVDTVHAFQGDERDIIIYSPVVSQEMGSGTLSFVDAEPNLINVAVTRAKEAFFFVGNVEFCASRDGYLGKLAQYCKEIQKMRDGGSEAEVELYGWMMMREWANEVQPQRVIHGQCVDFYINFNGQQVSVEVDGEHHNDQRGTDEARDTVLRTNGITPLRFTPAEIQKMPFNVIKKIEEHLQI